MQDILIKNGLIYIDGIFKKLNVTAKDGLITEIGSIDCEAKEIIDANGLHILPGMIDTQVHFREPGLVHKEDLTSGSKSAAAGGICTFFEMPNTKPATTTISATQEKINIAKKNSLTNFGFYIGASEDNLDELLKAEKLEGCCGVKIFLGSSTGDLLLYKRDVLIKIFKSIKMPIAVHSESEKRLSDRIDIAKNAKSVHAHYEWRDAQSAIESTRMIIDIAKEAGRKVHVLHVTTKEEMEFLRDNKDHCTVEVTPQHLSLSAPEIYDQIGTFAQMNPPIRTKEHTQALWEGLRNGTVDLIGSDHAPHTREEKSLPYPQSPSGMPGVQTILPIMLDHCAKGKLSIKELIKYMSETPAEMYQLNKGKIEVGRDADFSIINLKEKWTITDNHQHTKCGWTPFNNREIEGRPVGTVVMGKIAMLHDKLYNTTGQPIKRGKNES